MSQGYETSLRPETADWAKNAIEKQFGQSLSSLKKEYATNAITLSLINMNKGTIMKEEYAQKGAGLVIAVQMLLKEKGYNVGKLDGLIGNQFKQAVRDFQKFNNLKVDGQAGKETLQKLLEISKGLPNKLPKKTPEVQKTTTPQRKGIYNAQNLPILSLNDNSGKQELFRMSYLNNYTKTRETATFARGKGIQEAFDRQNIQVKDCRNNEEATQELKKIFSKYEKDLPGLWKEEDWFIADTYPELFKFLNNKEKGVLKDKHYAGCQYDDGTHRWAGSDSYQWFPLRVAGKFVYLWSNLDDERASFDFGGESAAHLV